MAVINKEKHLREIASLVRKGSFHFEPDDRPAVVMGGREVFVASVAFDPELECLTYTVRDAAGTRLASRLGERRLDALDTGTLAAVCVRAREYAALRSGRENDIVNIRSRLLMVGRDRKRLGL